MASTIKTLFDQHNQKKKNQLEEVQEKEDNIKIEVSEWERTVDRNEWLKTDTADEVL